MDAAYTPYYDALNANPLRYRGYVYDNETGFYYLQSRYYDPAVRRFINADSPEMAMEAGITDKNLFAYCDNNPIMRSDEDGEFWNVVIGAVVGVFSALSTWISGGSGEEILLSGICGEVSGGFAATGFGGIWGQMAVGAITSFVDSGYQDYNAFRSVDKTLCEAIANTVTNTILGGVFAGMGFEGTDAFKESKNITNKALEASKKL